MGAPSDRYLRQTMVTANSDQQLVLGPARATWARPWSGDPSSWCP
jgi:hypothetical protein